MKKRLVSVFCYIVFPLTASLASATPMLGFSPDRASVAIGDTVTLDLFASNLESADIAFFDIDVSFDDAVVALISVALSNALGDFNLGEAVDFSLPPEPGLVNLSVVSFLEDFSDQPDWVVLASLTFEGLGEGDAMLGLGFTALESPDFGPIEVEIADVQLAAVPLPAGIWLLLAGLTALFVNRARRSA